MRVRQIVQRDRQTKDIKGPRQRIGLRTSNSSRIHPIEGMVAPTGVEIAARVSAGIVHLVEGGVAPVGAGIIV